MGISGDKLEMLFVHDEMRDRGIGRLLLQHAIAQYHISKVDVNEQNIQAIGFYKNNGFKIVDRKEQDGEGRAYPILEMQL